MLHRHPLYDPATTIAEQVKKSLGGKIQASNRQRPTTLQMLTCFNRQVDEAISGTVRKTRLAVLLT